MQRFSPTFLINEISEAADVEEVAASHDRLSERDKLKKIFAHVGNLRKKLSGFEQGNIFF